MGLSGDEGTSAGRVGTGTVMRPSRLEGYAIDARLSGMQVLPIENELWRFYSLEY